jgi:LysR family transcriptional activator of nhaA
MPLALNYHHLYYFWRCVRAGRITAAAQELHLSQSALSLQLQSLERALDKALLTRTRKGVEMTPGGRVVFDHCERIFAAGDALSQALRGDRAEPPVVRLGVTAGLGRDVVLAALSALGDTPGAVTSIYVGPSEDVRDRLHRRQLDVALAVADFSPELGLPFRSSLVDARPLLLVAAPALARGWPRFPAARDVPMLLRSKENPLREAVLSWLRERGARPVPVAESEDSDLLRALALQGRGVAALAAPSVASAVAAGRLKVLARPALEQQVWINWHDVGVDGPVRRLVRDVPRLRQRLRAEKSA